MEAQTTFAAVVNEIGNLDSISPSHIPLPELEENQVLVQMECAPINFTDLMLASGRLGNLPTPKILGFEGSGTVIKSHSNPYSQSLLGKRVAALAPLQGCFGTFSEYLVTSAHSVVVLRDSVTFEQGAGLIISPFTVALMIEKLKEGNHTSVIFNAAASTIVKMAIRWCKSLNITTICLVRRQEQVDILTSLGVQHVFDTSKDGWKNEVKIITNELGTKIGFDCVAGTETQNMLDLLVDEGIVYVYGVLSGESSIPLNIGDKTVRGLLWIKWFFSLTAEKRAEVENTLQDLVGDILKTDFNAEVSLVEVKDAIKQYSERKTDRKFLVRIRRT